MEVSKRYRVLIKETAKREKYWECTVDFTGCTETEILEASDSLVAELDKKYPAPKDG